MVLKLFLATYFFLLGFSVICLSHHHSHLNNNCSSNIICLEVYKMHARSARLPVITLTVTVCVGKGKTTCIGTRKPPWRSNLSTWPLARIWTSSWFQTQCHKGKTPMTLLQWHRQVSALWQKDSWKYFWERRTCSKGRRDSLVWTPVAVRTRAQTVIHLLLTHSLKRETFAIFTLPWPLTHMPHYANDCQINHPIAWEKPVL